MFWKKYLQETKNNSKFEALKKINVLLRNKKNKKILDNKKIKQ